MKNKRWSQVEFDAELRRVLRRAMRLRAALAGDASVEAYYRAPYQEKKVRSYRGHWVHVIRMNKRRSQSAAKTVH